MDKQTEDSDHITVGSSTVQVVDSSTPPDNMALLLPEGSAVFGSEESRQQNENVQVVSDNLILVDEGLVMEGTVMADRSDYTEPDQSQYQTQFQQQNYVQSSEHMPDQDSVQTSQVLPDDSEISRVSSNNPENQSDNTTADAVPEESSSNNIQVESSLPSSMMETEDSQSPQAVPEVDFTDHNLTGNQPVSSDDVLSASQSNVYRDPTEITNNIEASPGRVESYTMEEDGMVDMAVQESELQVVPDSGGSVTSHKPDTSSSSWISADAHNTDGVELLQSTDAVYPTSSEAQMVPISSEAHHTSLTATSVNIIDVSSNCNKDEKCVSSSQDEQVMVESSANEVNCLFQKNDSEGTDSLKSDDPSIHTSVDAHQSDANKIVLSEVVSGSPEKITESDHLKEKESMEDSSGKVISNSCQYVMMCAESTATECVDQPRLSKINSEYLQQASNLIPKSCKEKTLEDQCLDQGFVPNEPAVQTKLNQELQALNEPSVESTLDQELQTSNKLAVDSALEPELQVSNQKNEETELNQEMQATNEPTLKITLDKDLNVPDKSAMETEFETQLQVTNEPDMENALEHNSEAPGKPDVKNAVEQELETPYEPAVESILEQEPQAANEKIVESTLYQKLQVPSKSCVEYTLDQELQAPKKSAVENASDQEVQKEQAVESALDQEVQTQYATSVEGALDHGNEERMEFMKSIHMSNTYDEDQTENSYQENPELSENENFINQDAYQDSDNKTTAVYLQTAMDTLAVAAAKAEPFKITEQNICSNEINTSLSETGNNPNEATYPKEDTNNGEQQIDSTLITNPSESLISTAVNQALPKQDMLSDSMDVNATNSTQTSVINIDRPDSVTNECILHERENETAVLHNRNLKILESGEPPSSYSNTQTTDVSFQHIESNFTEGNNEALLSVKNEGISDHNTLLMRSHEFHDGNSSYSLLESIREVVSIDNNIGEAPSQSETGEAVEHTYAVPVHETTSEDQEQITYFVDSTSASEVEGRSIQFIMQEGLKAAQNAGLILAVDEDSGTIQEASAQSLCVPVRAEQLLEERGIHPKQQYIVETQDGGEVLLHFPVQIPITGDQTNVITLDGENSDIEVIGQAENVESNSVQQSILSSTESSEISHPTHPVTLSIATNGVQTITNEASTLPLGQLVTEATESNSIENSTVFLQSPQKQSSLNESQQILLHSESQITHGDSQDAANDQTDLVSTAHVISSFHEDIHNISETKVQVMPTQLTSDANQIHQQILHDIDHTQIQQSVQQLNHSQVESSILQTVAASSVPQSDNGATEVMYMEPTVMQMGQNEEIHLLENTAYETAAGTIIQSASIHTEGIIEAGNMQHAIVTGENGDEFTMTLTEDGQLIPTSEYNSSVEIQEPSPQVIDLGESASFMNADNMQALIQILQALPLSTQGQTVQIVLQGGSAPTPPPPQVQQVYQVTEIVPQQQQKEQVLHVVQLMAPNSTSTPVKTVSDMAVQATPDADDQVEMIIPDLINRHDIRVMEGDADMFAPYMPTDNALLSKQLSTSKIGLPVSKQTLVRASSTMQQESEPEDIVFDTKAGISYYAVIDYLSEQEQEGYSSTQELQRPEAPCSGFMEDHLELQSENEGFQNRSLLESTIDDTTIVSPFRRRGRYRVMAVSQPGASIDLPVVPSMQSVTLKEKSYEQTQLEGQNLAEQTYNEWNAVVRPPKYRTARTAQRRLNHKCGYCEYDSRDKFMVIQHCHTQHPDLPIKTLMLLPRLSHRACPYCKQEFTHAEFFQHMKYTHNEVHPYKCFYCDFQGRDRNQVKHHIRKKHARPIKIINLMREPRSSLVNGKRRIMSMSEGEESVYEYLTDDEEEDDEEAMQRKGLICPECKKTFKTLKYLKTHIKMHRPQRFQCGYCDYIATLEHQIIKHSIRKHVNLAPKVITKELEPDKHPLISRNIEEVIKKVFALSLRQPRDPDHTKWARKWVCPHCDYTCQFGASFRRHVRMHANLLPFKCNYCSFKGREKYYVRRHIARMHRGLPEIVVDNTAENRAGDSSSDEDFQEKGLRRRRRRRVKDIIKAVIPVDSVPLPPDVQVVVKKEILERGVPAKESENICRFGKKRPLPESNENEDPTLKSVRLSRPEESTKTKYSRLPRTVEWSGEDVSDYFGGRDGEKFICKVCNLKIHSKAFYKHIRKHFLVKPFKCSYCKYVSIERAKIRVHITLKHPTLPFKIEECHLASMDPEEIIEVFSAKNSSNSSKTEEEVSSVKIHFSCPICQQEIDTAEKLIRQHFYSHYEYEPFKCGSCGNKFVSEEMLEVHANVVHGEAVEVLKSDDIIPEGLEDTIQQFLKETKECSEMTGVIKKPTSEYEEGERGSQFQCPICDKIMNCHTVTVRRHCYSHYDYKPFKCGYCTFIGASEGEIRQHTVTHGNVPCKIELSDAEMPEELEIMLEKFLEEMKHTQKSQYSKSFIFEETDSLITEEGQRWRDKLLHGVCPWCEEDVGHFRPNAHRHLKAHFQCKPYRCGHCGLPANDRSDVRYHISENHKDSPFSVIGPIIELKEVEEGLYAYFASKGKADFYSKKSKDDVTSSIEKTSKSAKRRGNRSKFQRGSYHSDSEIMEVKDTGAVLLMRSFKSDAEMSTESSDSEDEEDNINSVREQTSDISTPPITPELVKDVQFLLKLSYLPRDKPYLKKKLDWYKCFQCPRKFRKHNAYKLHVAKEHRMAFHCVYCNYWSAEKSLVRTHILNCHPGRRMIIKEKANGKRRGPQKRSASPSEETPKKQKKIEDENLPLKLDPIFEESLDKITEIIARNDSPFQKRRGRKPKWLKVLESANVAQRELLEERIRQKLSGTSIKYETKMLISTPKTESPEEQEVDTKKEDSETDESRISTGNSEMQTSKYQLRGRSRNEDEQLDTSVDSVDKIESNKATRVVPKIKEETDICQMEEKDTLNRVQLVEQQLESLEECDENLPKILQILRLRPAKSETEK